MQWAAGNLLQRDWPADNQELHAQAQEQLKALKQLLEKEQRASEALRLGEAAERLRERDLVVVLSWQGAADLDLEVREPTGTVCSYLQRQTAGGGTLLSAAS